MFKTLTSIPATAVVVESETTEKISDSQIKVTAEGTVDILAIQKEIDSLNSQLNKLTDRYNRSRIVLMGQLRKYSDLLVTKNKDIIKVKEPIDTKIVVDPEF